MVSTFNLNDEEKEESTQKCLVPDSVQQQSSSTIEKAEKTKSTDEDRKRRIAERLKRGSIRAKKLQMEKEAKINEGRMSIMQKAKALQDVLFAKEKIKNDEEQ